jgi:cell division transport system permease protein
MAAAGWLAFRRNAWLSAATIMVLGLTLFVLGNLVFVGAVANTALRSLESRIDISIYFAEDTQESQILAAQRDIETLPDVRDTAYISRDEALARFRERHKDDALIAGALDELGGNPLQASITVRAQDPMRYAAISQAIAQKNYSGIAKINYFENQAVIDRLASIASTIRGSGAALALFLAFVAVLVAFNTVRLAIYTMREEISIMRLVGATAWFIRGPFLMTGVLYGIVAAIAVTAVFFPLTWLISPKISILVPGFNLFPYFLSNLLQFFAIMCITGVTLAVGSSYFAVRRYLTL